MTNATPWLWRFTPVPLLAGLFCGLLFAGCGKSPETPKHPAPATTNAASAPVVAGPGPGEKICFACKGEDTVACRAPGCVEGKVDCPGPCLKLSRGVWIHKTVAGHDPSELWQEFPNRDGQGGGWSWNQNHVGEVIEYQNGKPANIGKCKVCNGTTKVTCSACKGTGKQTCPICGGKKFIPDAWTPTNNPYFNSQPDVIRLADGRVLLGRVAASVGDDRTIVTRDKKILHVKASDILPRAETNAPAAPTAPAK
jgi:hypothetical protein